MISRIFITFLALLFAYSPSSSRAQEIPRDKMQLQLSYAPLVKKVSPAVVNIYTKRAVQASFRSPFMDDPFFGNFFNQDFFGGRMRQYVENALGSGVIVSEGGLVVTNAHVIEDAQEISVVLKSGAEYIADIVLSDEASDLALLRIRSNEKDETFPYVTLRPSETLEVGDLVIAIGNPFGVGQTVTGGIISAKGRSSLNVNDYNFFIQTDAAINPGNSGGPLVAMDGRVVGINTAIFSRSGGSMGLGFAIPSEMVASVIAAEINGQVSQRGIIRPWLGVKAQDISADIASSLELNTTGGALISDMHQASPFAKAGVEVGDIIKSLDGKSIKNAAELKFLMATVPLGRQANVEILREGKTSKLKIKAIAPPDIPARKQMQLTGSHILKGAIVANLNPAVSVELGLPVDEDKGVVLIKPPPGFFSRTFHAGDIIVSINSQDIKTPGQVEEALKENSRGNEMMLKRQGSLMRMYLR